MSFRTTSPQLGLFEPVHILPPDKKSRLENSWAGVFRNDILPLIDEELFRDSFHADNGRPNKSIRLTVGLSILKELNDMTDAELIDAVEFNLLFQYALGLDPSTAHIAQKTLHNHRMIMLKNGLGKRIFEKITKGLVEKDGLNLGKQRLDSTHVISNIAILTRLRLVVETVSLFLRQLRKEFPPQLSRLDTKFRTRYLEREGYFADAKKSQGKRRLEAVGMDAHYLIKFFEEESDVFVMNAYQILLRLFEEQFNIVNNTDELGNDVQKVTKQDNEEKTTTIKETAPKQKKKSNEAKRSDVKSDDTRSDDARSDGDRSDGDRSDYASSNDARNNDRSDDAGSDGGGSDDIKEDDKPDEASLIQAKEGSEISSSSLQSPHDPDVSYGHKGKGFEVQISETCDKSNDYQVITSISVNGANVSDQVALFPVLNNLVESGLNPEEMMADMGYGSGSNILACAEIGIDLQAPVRDPKASHKASTKPQTMTESIQEIVADSEKRSPSNEQTESVCDIDNDKKIDIDSFGFDSENLRVLSCPNKQKPIFEKQNTKTNSVLARFSNDKCRVCPLASRCPSKELKTGNRSINLSAEKIEIARRQRIQQTSEFKESYKIRSGIEATNSEIKRRHGAGNLRVRGQGRVELSVQMKAIALNFKRAAQSRAAQRAAERKRHKNNSFILFRLNKSIPMLGIDSENIQLLSQMPPATAYSLM